MQPRQTPAKPKYRIKDFAATGNHAINKTVFSNSASCKISCICNQYSNQKSKKCTRCGASYHACVAPDSDTKSDWECLHCSAKFLDPIFVPEETLVETFFKTQSVFSYQNHIEFIFSITAEQIKNPVELRVLQEGRIGLAWPMQGQFYLNKDEHQESILDIKPLLTNSNRKHRKQQAFFLPPQKLKVGRNVLIFSIPKLNSATFKVKYQVEERAVYFLGVYSIVKLSKQELIQKTFQTRKIDKEASLQLLRKISNVDDPQLAIDKTKLCLECPYMKSRIKIPIRGKKCMHYTVICLDTLIQTRAGMNSREWFCPICNGPMNEPVIDMFILKMLSDGSAGVEVTVDIHGNYEWLSVEDDKMSLSSDSNSLRQTKNQKPADKVLAPIKQAEIEPQINNKISKISAEFLRPKEISKIVEKSKLSEPKGPIETIDLEDDEPIVPKKATVLLNQKVNILQQDKLQKQRVNREKQLEAQKNNLKKSLKQKQKKKKPVEDKDLDKNKVIQISSPQKGQFLISDIRQMEFRLMNFLEFSKKYFTLELNREKVPEDLQVIFKEVL